MSDSRVEIATRAFEAWERRDFDSFDEYAVADFEFVPAIASGVEGGSFDGIEGVRRFFESLDEAWESFRVVTEEFHEVGGRVLISSRVQARGRGSGLELDQPLHNVVWFEGDKFARVQSFLDRDQALDAASKKLEEVR